MHHDHHHTGTSTLVERIRGAITERRFQLAIDLTLKRFPDLRRATYNQQVKGEAVIRATRIIEMGPEAFYWPEGKASPSWLASSLFHEAVHYDQRFGPKYRWGMDTTQGGHLNEAEAYKGELDRAQRHGLNADERKEVQRRYDKEINMYLRPPYNDQARRGDFSVPEIYLIPRDQGR